jgi:hypothetical protein
MRFHRLRFFVRLFGVVVGFVGSSCLLGSIFRTRASHDTDLHFSYPGEARQSMTLIQIPDDQAAALQAKAAAQGLTLEAWLKNLAGLEKPQVRKGRYRLADLVAQCDSGAPLSEEDKAWLDGPDVGREGV